MCRETAGGDELLLVAALLCLPACVSPGTGGAYDPTISEWRPGAGWRPAAGTTGPRKTSVEKLRSESREAFDAASHRDALRGYLALRKTYPRSTEAKDAETAFMIAECYYHLGENEYSSAYPYYLEVLKGNPREEMLKTSLGRIYDIGRAFLDGRAKKTFLGVPYKSPSFGVEIFLGEQGLVTNYPFLSYSEDALMEVAKYYFDRGEYPEAEQVFERLVLNYPQSTWNASAEYFLALSVYRQVRGVDYDLETLRQARTKFNLYLNHHPRGSQVEDAREKLREIAEKEGRHDLMIAKYYLRESQPQAAILYLRSVIFNNPRTEAAREAREIFEYMERRRGGG